MVLQNKITLAIMAPMLTCFVIYAVFITEYAYDTLIESEMDRLTVAADAHTSGVRIVIDGYRDKAALVATRTRLRKLLAKQYNNPSSDDRGEMSRIVADAMSADKAIAAISVIDLHGTVVAATDTASIGKPVSTLDSGRRELPVDWLEPSVQTLIDSQTVKLVVSAPAVLDEQLIGLVQTTFFPTALDQRIVSAHFGRTGEIVLGQPADDGTVHFVASVRSNASAAATQLARRDDLLVIMNHALNGENVASHEGTVDYNGTPVLAVTRFLPDVAWGLVAKIDRAEAIEKFAAARFALILLGGALISICLATARVFAARLAQANTGWEHALAGREHAEARFQEIFRTAPTPLLMVASDGRIILANGQVETLLGYDMAALTGMCVDELVPEASRTSHQSYREHFASERTQRVMGKNRDVHAVHKNGSKVTVEIGLTPVDTGDGPMVVVALVDLTEREIARRELEQYAEALLSSNRELDEFAYVASHDLKAPLRGIDQLATFIEEDAGHLLPEESSADLAKLRNRVARMEGFLNGLLQYSRVGRKEGEPTQVSTQEVLEQVVELYGVDGFTIVVPPDLPPVYAPLPAVELVFRNLVMNAIKHHDRTQGVVQVGWRTDDKFVHITVRDDGPGIASEFKDKIFQLFQTLKARDETESSGMGLALVKKTVEAHGGSVELLLSNGRGATFEVSWPACGATGEQRAA